MPAPAKPNKIPGPKSRATIKRRDRYVSAGLRTALPLDIVRAEGALMEDADGNTYIDLGSGIGVHNAGHRPPNVVHAAKRQLDRFMHASVLVAAHQGYADLAERMARLSPPGLTKSIFLNSGSEAIENAIKIARAHTRKAGIISFRTAFHGRTLLDISLTGKEKPYREGFGPLFPGVHLANYPYAYRDPESRRPADHAKACADEIEEHLHRPDVEGTVACLIAEPLQGEAGMVVPPKEFFPLLRRLCDKHGILLIDDEVQAGAGRTGKWWAIEHWRTKPDLIVSGKAIGGGLPYGGVTGRADVMDSAPTASLGGTFGGNPVVCAAALAAIPAIQRAMRNAPRVESILRTRLTELQDGFESVGDVRGLGAMFAVEFVKDRRSKQPDTELPRAVQLEAMERGVIVITAGFHNNCIRFLPPLNIAPKLLEQSMDRFADALAAAVAA